MIFSQFFFEKRFFFTEVTCTCHRLPNETEFISITNGAILRNFHQRALTNYAGLGQENKIILARKIPQSR